MAATDAGAGGAAGFLTRKVGPLPVWAWVAIGVAGFVLLRSRRSSASSSSSTTDALAAQGAAAAQYGYTAPDLASMISQLQSQVSMLGFGNMGLNRDGAISPGNTGNPASTPTPVLQGSGYWIPNSEQPVRGQGGHMFEWIPNPAAMRTLPRGTAVWVQTVPGYFSEVGKVGAGTVRLAPNTPQFLEIS